MKKLATSLLLQLLLGQMTLLAAAAEDKCAVCDRMVEAFQAGLQRTAKDNFGGGNTHWEESRLGSWATSETRLVDIQEKLCDGEAKDAATACHALLEQLEEAIESWWFGDFRSGGDASAAGLRDLLCVRRAGRCCPRGAFGPDCAPCPACAAPGGSCEGNGTRAGSGLCKCDRGYGGDLCGDCADGHYRTEGAEGPLCSPCHPACGPGGCRGGAGPENCARDCAPGYSPAAADEGADVGVTCVDVDECATAPAAEGSAEKPPACPGPHERCVNSPGSFACECEPGHRRATDGARECELEPAPPATAETGGESPETGGESPETSGESPETGGESTETGEVSSETGGESAETGHDEMIAEAIKEAADKEEL